MNPIAPDPVVRRATLADLPALAPLFDAYRRFYDQPADPARALSFMRDRLSRNESIVFVAQPGAATGTAAAAPGAPDRLGGFCQLYPGWCSVAAGPIFVLYDLYVDDAWRRQSLGRRLMLAAQAHAREAGAVRLDLSTARTNVRAQALYESLGWKRDDVFLTYSLETQPADR